MKALEILKKFQDEIQTVIPNDIDLYEAIKEIEDLEESNKELLEGLISTQKKLEEWLEKCN